MEAAVIPFPREEMTPPVMKMYFAICPCRPGREERRVPTARSGGSAQRRYTLHALAFGKINMPIAGWSVNAGHEIPTPFSPAHGGWHGK